MLAVAGTTLLQGLAVRPLLAQALSHISPCRTLSSKSGPLSLFICAADEASDQAGAALVTALKQLTGRQVELHGVGGRLLQDLGLHCVVDEDQLHSLAAAEVIPPTYKLLQGPGGDSISKGSYAKIFRDFIWEAALDGCRGRPSPAGDQQQQQQEQYGPGPHSSSTTAPTGSGQLCYDAVVTVGSPIAAQMTLNFLHQAEKMQKAKLPVVVQYMVPDLWDHQSTTAAAARWSKLVHHIMCSLPFEPALLHVAGVPSSFVGHPLLQQLLGSSSSTSSFGGKARLLSSLLKQRQQQQQQQQRQLPVQSHQQLFAAGDAAAFWKLYDATYALQQEAAAAEAEAQAAGTSGPNSSSSSSSSVSARQTSRRKQLQGLQRQNYQQQQQVPTSHQQDRLLLALLPGTTEAEVISSMAAFDQITQQLQESHPHLIATLHVPEVLAKAAVMATVNFKVPVLVVTAGEKRAADALAAAAAALSHPGPASLDAVAVGLPLVCVRDGSLLKGAWSKWRQRHALPYGSIPNLLLGRVAVPEVNLWENGAVDTAVGAVRQLLAAHTAGPAAVSVSAAVSAAGDAEVDAAAAGVQLVQQQKGALQEALLQLVPPAQQQQQQGAGDSAGVRAGSSWQLPAEAAARTLLELIELRQQQEQSLSQSQPPRQHTQGHQRDSSSTAGVGSSTAGHANSSNGVARVQPYAVQGSG